MVVQNTYLFSKQQNGNGMGYKSVSNFQTGSDNGPAARRDETCYDVVLLFRSMALGALQTNAREDVAAECAIGAFSGNYNSLLILSFE
jgi:hypothetical protein